MAKYKAGDVLAHDDGTTFAIEYVGKLSYMGEIVFPGGQATETIRSIGILDDSPIWTKAVIIEKEVPQKILLRRDSLMFPYQKLDTDLGPASIVGVDVDLRITDYKVTVELAFGPGGPWV